MTTKGGPIAETGTSTLSRRKNDRKRNRKSHATYHEIEQMDTVSYTKTSISKQSLEDRLNDLKVKLERESARMNAMESAPGETRDLFVESVASSFSLCAPFTESALMTAFKINPKRMEQVVSSASINVLSAPIKVWCRPTWHENRRIEHLRRASSSIEWRPVFELAIYWDIILWHWLCVFCSSTESTAPNVSEFVRRSGSEDEGDSLIAHSQSSIFMGCWWHCAVFTQSNLSGSGWGTLLFWNIAIRIDRFISVLKAICVAIVDLVLAERWWIGILVRDSDGDCSECEDASFARDGQVGRMLFAVNTSPLQRVDIWKCMISTVATCWTR